jgi:glucose/arabinose dehydrogenase
MQNAATAVRRSCAVCILTSAFCIVPAGFFGSPPATLQAQTHNPAPAFPGQTRAPAPAKASAPVRVQTLATGLTGAWAIAFLPDGRILVTQNAGTMRVVGSDGVVFGPVSGVPPVKQIGAQGLHDVVLDPEFTKNRRLYFTYFAPPRGEPAGTWPVEFFYERVWTRPFAERRTMQLGHERVARARLSEDHLRLDRPEAARA